MVAIPLGLQAYERTNTGYPEVILRNLYLEEDKSGASVDQVLRLQRPGLRKLLDFPAPIRAIYQTDGVFGGQGFVVAGTKFYRTDFATITEIGEVENDNLPARIEANFEHVAIVSAGKYYIYDGETVENVPLPDDKAPIDLAVINSYFILPLSNGTFYWQTPGVTGFDDTDDDPTNDLEPLNFATAEANPDGLLAVMRLRDDLFFFGPRSIEVWQTTGDAEATFRRAGGRMIDRGCQSRETVVGFDNSVVFVGEDNLVYRLQDVPIRISTAGIEERIRKRSNDCSAFQFTADGHKFYVLRIPSQGTFAYDAATQTWSEFSTIGAATWTARLGLDTAIGPIAADDAGGLLALDPRAPTDDGAPIERTVTGTVALTARRIPNSSVAIYFGCDDETIVNLRWKDALTEWSEPRQLTARAGSDIINAWRLGATRGAHRTFEISTASISLVRISSASANDARAS